MPHRVVAASVFLAAAVTLLLPEDASARGRRSGTLHCTPCYIPCPPIPCSHPCYAVAWRDPYQHKLVDGKRNMLVWCYCCPNYPGWSWCWYYIDGQRRGQGWVKIRYFLHREPTSKEYGGEFEEGAEAPSATAMPATIVATLPADAKLTIDEQPTVSTSSTRVFATPPLESGRDYHYTLKAEIVRDGKLQSVIRRVTVRAAEETRVNLEIPDAVAAS
jgi:uncharacterized protein (TIGR03000 family)